MNFLITNSHFLGTIFLRGKDVFQVGYLPSPPMTSINISFSVNAYTVKSNLLPHHQFVYIHNRMHMQCLICMLLHKDRETVFYSSYPCNSRLLQHCNQRSCKCNGFDNTGDSTSLTARRQ